MDRRGEDYAKLRIRASTLGDMLLCAFDRFPAKEALVFPGERKTYAQVVAGVMQRARGLRALGVAPGQHVGVLLPSSIEFVETMFAVAMCGGVSVLMNARYRPPELAYVAENADLTTIITNTAIADQVDFVARLNEAFPDLASASNPHNLELAGAPRLKRMVLHGGAEAAGFVGQAAFDAAAPTIDEAAIHHNRLGVRIRDTAMILYTSGTSANPKGCLLSHEAVVREAANLSRNRWAFSEDERAWSPLPLFHVAAMLAMLAAIDIGGAFVGQTHFDPGMSLKQIEEERATMLFLPFVTFHQAMIDHPAWEKTDFSSVRLMNSCFAVMPDRVGQAYRDKAPHVLHCGTFGMTEASGIVTTGGYDMDPETGFQTLGYPMAGVSVRIVDTETAADLPAGERGEVLIKGYSLFDGYYRDPERTAEALDAEGWYHSGDIGSIDANGHLMFHGRFKDMLKVGGENVAAAEVEAVLAAHPAVKLAQVIGLPDARLAEAPAAYVELNTGAEADEAELIAFAKKRLASFKIPRHIRFIAEWPMSASKIQKFKLRKQLMEELGLEE